MANCQVINHTPAGYALRQTDPDADGAAHRRAHRVARRGPHRPAGRDGALVPQHDEGERARVRLRAPVRQPRGRRPRRRRTRRPASSQPVVVLPEDRRQAGPERVAAADHRRRPARSGSSRAIALTRGKRDGLRRADQARRAGPGLRALRVRRRRLIAACHRAAGCRAAQRHRVAVAGLAALALLELLWETAARAAAPGRLVARAEGAAARARCGPASRAATRRPRQIAVAAAAALFRRSARARADRSRPPRASSRRWPRRSRVATFVALLASFRARARQPLTRAGRAVRLRRLRVPVAGEALRQRKHDASPAMPTSSRTPRAPSSFRRAMTSLHQHLRRRRARRDADARLARDPLGRELVGAIDHVRGHAAIRRDLAQAVRVGAVRAADDDHDVDLRAP